MVSTATRTRALHSYAGIIRLRQTAWEVVCEAAVNVALWAYRRAQEAQECAELVAERAGCCNDEDTP